MPRPSPSPSLKVPVSDRGYIVALTFWEQLVCASKNLAHLRCWAKTLDSGVSVVQPFLLTNRSGLGFTFASESSVSPLSLYNVYNMATCDRKTPFAPLVSKKDLLSDMNQFAMHVILVQIKYLPSRTDTSCTFSWNTTDVMEQLQDYEYLYAARNVCINLIREITPSEFKSLVFGNKPPKSSLVIFNEWRGFGPGRTYIRRPYCPNTVCNLSNKVWRDAENYAKKHLKDFDNYISVSARFEKVHKRYASMKNDERRQIIVRVTEQALKKVRELKKLFNLTKVHLSYDYGRFGSQTFKHNMKIS